LGGGLVWLASDPSPAAAQSVRAAVRQIGGHATLIRAPDEFREIVDVFEPLTPAVKELTRGIKASFDPDGIFNFGRMYSDI
jgi:glycolate oxidase FAD binding subunit